MILDIIKEFENTPGSNDKKALLETYKDNATLRRVLQYAMDDTLTVGIKAIPEHSPGTITPALTLEQGLDFVAGLHDRMFTGNDARSRLSTVLSSLSIEDADVLVRVVRKKLNTSIPSKSVNAVYGTTIVPIEPYMRCDLLSEDTVHNIESFETLGYAYSEVKMDGQYLNTVVRGNSVLAMSRNSKEYDFLGLKDKDFLDLKNEMQKDARFESGVVFMGECLVLDDDGNILPRTTGNGIIQKAGKDSISESEAERVCFVLWDAVPYEAYRNGVWNVERSERRTVLLNAISALSSQYIRPVEMRKVHNLDEVFDYNAELMADGHEGTVLKCEHGIWKAHTSPKQLKVKMVMEFDLLITGFNEGEDKRKGTLGSISVASADGLVQCNVGTGFKEKNHEWTLDAIWAKREELMGGVITVKSNGLVKDKKRKSDVQKLFLPAFVEFRFDKDTADDYPRILEIIESSITVLKNTLKETVGKSTKKKKRKG